jgi:hypothetical protein
VSRLNLLGRAARAADELDNLWLKDCTTVELQSLEASMAGNDPDPEMARRIRARVKTRRRLALPHVDCTARKPGDCRCLTAALIEYELFAVPGLAKVSKAEVLARSSKLHSEHSKRNKPKLKPKPLPRPDVSPEMPAGRAQAAPEPPKPSPDTSEPPPTPQPRFRPVRRTPKWFDEDERGSIIDRIF